MSAAGEALTEAERRYGKPESRVTEFGRHATANEIAGFIAGAEWRASRNVAEVERLTSQLQAASVMTDAEYRTRVHAEIRRTLELFTPAVSRAVVRTVADAVLAIGVRA